MYLYDNLTLKWTCCAEDGTEAALCLHVQQDDSGEDNPRDYEHDTEMMCWVKGYAVGDENEFKEPEDWWQDCVRRYVPSHDALQYFLDAKPSDDYKAVPDPNHDGMYLVLEYWDGADLYDESEYESHWWIKYENISETDFIYWTLDLLSIRDCMNLLAPYAVWLPIWAYIHSGITITAGARVYPYNDEWDSGQAGWAFLSKESSKHFWGDDADWEEKGKQLLLEEVSQYDSYLRGEVYGYTLYELHDDDESDDEAQQWVGLDSCWGFIGDDLIKNGMADNVGHGLSEAIKAGAVEEDEAKGEYHPGYYTYVF